MKRFSRFSIPAGMLAALALGGCQESPAEPSGALLPDIEASHAAHAASDRAPAHALAAADLAELRKVTARYHRVEAALADGFVAPPADDCIAAPPGGMGFHFVNPARMDLAIDPALPEALLYEPMSNGKLRLVGAEFLVHGDGWDSENADPPVFAGMEFDPPSDRTALAPPGPFYTLHVWIWKDNPSGMFAPFNPRVSCD